MDTSSGGDMNTLEAYLATCSTKHIAKGTIIVMQDEVPRYGFGVKHGIVKTYNLTAQGEEKSISFSVKTDIFPICWIFSKAKSALFYHQAHTDCEVYAFDRKDFMAHLAETPKLAYLLLDKHVEGEVDNLLRVNALAQTKAYAKVACTLRHLCLRYGEDIGRDRVRINLPLTQQELANIVGLTRETAFTELKKLTSQGIISKEGKLYTVNTSLLNECLDDEYNPGILLG
jgi:CRP/FNR family transcriptional regulator, cyclic AMP receptor protein